MKRQKHFSKYKIGKRRFTQHSYTFEYHHRQLWWFAGKEKVIYLTLYQCKALIMYPSFEKQKHALPEKEELGLTAFWCIGQSITGLKLSNQFSYMCLRYLPIKFYKENSCNLNNYFRLHIFSFSLNPIYHVSVDHQLKLCYS